MRITRLEAQNIGPFEKLDMEFKPKPEGMENKAEIHILTGENGTGKSTILMMLASYADNNNDDSIKKRYRYNQAMIVRKVNDLQCFFKIDFNNLAYFSSYSSINLNGVDQFESSITSNISRFHINYGKYNVNTVFFAYSGYRQISTLNNVSILESTIDPLDKSIEFDKKLDFDLIINLIANSKTKMLFAQNRKDYKTSEKHGKTVSKIEGAISNIIKKRVEFEIIDDPSFKLMINIGGKSYDFNILPDGLKSIISWLSDLLMRLDRINWADKNISVLEQNFILFLDEIEVHLHPTWQRKILPVVQDLFPNAQIFISTHSPFVVGSVDGARVYKFKLDDNNNSVLEKEYWTEDGNSYDRILEEIFDVKERFGVGVEQQLAQFKEFKNHILQGESIDNQSFTKLVENLSSQSVELSNMMGFEIRQIERLTKKNLEAV